MPVWDGRRSTEKVRMRLGRECPRKGRRVVTLGRKNQKVKKRQTIHL